MNKIISLFLCISIAFVIVGCSNIDKPLENIKDESISETNITDESKEVSKEIIEQEYTDKKVVSFNNNSSKVIEKLVMECLPEAEYINSEFEPNEAKGNTTYYFKNKDVEFVVYQESCKVTEATGSFISEGKPESDYMFCVMDTKYDDIINIMEKYNTHLLDMKVDGISLDNATKDNPSLSERIKNHNGLYINFTGDILFSFVDSEEDIKNTFSMLKDMKEMFKPYFQVNSNEVCSEELHIIFISDKELETPASMIGDRPLYGNVLSRDFYSKSMYFTEDAWDLDNLEKEAVEAYNKN